MRSTKKQTINNGDLKNKIDEIIVTSKVQNKTLQKILKELREKIPD
jgi:hypothetical protein